MKFRLPRNFLERITLRLESHRLAEKWPTSRMFTALLTKFTENGIMVFSFRMAAGTHCLSFGS
jgi:hypothetical protein